uniref:F-box protein CPR1-like n=1 Tax=Erigeron canadensis TaxID=72917 RepID=UPI001CB983CA|nr:F-box protein CPR1-like [Erigeron canadensis]
MAGVYELPDPVLENILARLDAKALIRCICVSKHWNRLITDPYFMKSRARPSIIFLAAQKHFDLLLADINDNSMIKLSSTYGPWRSKGHRVFKIIGTINGIVLFRNLGGAKVGDLMLFNPFTLNYMLLPPASHGSAYFCKHSVITYNYAYGFGYGSGTPDDLKIVKFTEYNKGCPDNLCGGSVCEIFSLKEFTWSKPQDMNIKHIEFETTVGTFLNGFLYWTRYNMDKLIVLDVAKIVLSEIHLPFKRSYGFRFFGHCSHLGTMHGCLCLLNRSMNDIDYNLWVMNDQADENSWSIKCSFTLPEDVNPFYHEFICILDNGRIFMMNKEKLHIYDPSDESYTMTDVSISSNDSIQGIEYVETLVSLSDVCSA